MKDPKDFRLFALVVIILCYIATTAFLLYELNDAREEISCGQCDCTGALRVEPCRCTEPKCECVCALPAVGYDMDGGIR